MEDVPIGRVPRPPTIVVIVVFALLLVPAAEAEGTLQGRLITDQAATLGGVHEVEGSGGLAATWAGGTEVAVEVDRLSVQTEWERGWIVQSPEGELVRRVLDNGREYHNFTDAELRVDAWKAPGQLLVVPNGTADVAAAATGASLVTALGPDQWLTKVGYGPTRSSAGGNGEGIDPGFWYRTERPLVAHRRLDEARATGSFSLFANNVTLQVDDGSTRWTNWTGYRVQGPDEPMTEYELRVSVLRIHGGDLSVTSTGGITLLSPVTDTAIEGAIELEQARGALSDGDDPLRLDGAPLVLRGRGQIAWAVADTSGGGEEGEDEGPGLRLEPVGAFDVQSREHLDMRGLEQAEAPAGLLWTPWVIAAGVVGLGVVLFAAVVVHPRRTLQGVPFRLRRWLYARLKLRGGELEVQGKLAAAGRRYAWLAKIFPERPTGWYRWVRVLHERRAYEAVLETIRGAEEELIEMPTDFLEYETVAAARLGRRQQAKQAFLELAGEAPEVARGLLEEVPLDGLGEDPEIQDAIEDDERGLPGYV